MNPVAKRTLLELAVKDLVGFVRETVECNTSPGGRPAAAVEPLARALARFDELGGQRQLSYELSRLTLMDLDADAAAGREVEPTFCLEGPFYPRDDAW